MKVNNSVLGFFVVVILFPLTFTTELHAKDADCAVLCRAQAIVDILACVTTLQAAEAACVADSVQCMNEPAVCAAEYQACVAGAIAFALLCDAAADAAFEACMEGCEAGEDEEDEAEEGSDGQG